ncbi:MAG: hypothetical protein ACREOM_00015 [Candidatus Dormibacteraceae bacterium]
MSQIPPPPPSQPSPMGGGTPSAAGSNKNLYTILAWALFPPIGSLIFLFVGKDDPDVKANSANAVLVHGAMFAVYIVLWVISAIIWPLAIIATIWGFIWFVVWVLGVILALQAAGRRVNFPVLGPMVASYIPMVEGWAK